MFAILLYECSEKEILATAEMLKQMNVCYACGERPVLVCTDEDFRKIIAMEAYHTEAGSIYNLKVIVEDVPNSRIEIR